MRCEFCNFVGVKLFKAVINSSRKHNGEETLQ